MFKKIMVLFFFLFSFSSLVNDSKIKSKVPAKISGTLSYASLNFWMGTTNKNKIDLLLDDVSEEKLRDYVGKEVILNDSLIKYYNDHVSFEPIFDENNKPVNITAKQIPEGLSGIYVNNEMIYSTNEYYSIGVNEAFLFQMARPLLLG